MPDLSKKLHKELNKQIQEEIYSAYLNYAMAAWFEAKTLPGFAVWLKVQALEELSHAHKFYRHIILDRMSEIELLPIEAPPKSWDSPIKAFEAAFKHEQHITGRIHMLVKMAREEGDYAVETALLQWFVSEQIEEETQTEEVVKKLTMIGDDKVAFYMLDKEMGARTFVAPPGFVL
jgi:ferritin